MSEALRLTSPPIVPIYTQTEPNQTIDLGRAAIQYDHKGSTHQDTAKVKLRFTPSERLEFVCPLDDKSTFFGMEFLVDSDPKVKITLKDRGVSFDAFFAGSGEDHGGIVFLPTNSGLSAMAASEGISTATFHLFNFPEFRSPEDYVLLTGEPPHQGGKVCGKVVLAADGWRIVVAATDQTDKLCKELKAQGGYVLTHAGHLGKEDGGTFSSAALEDLLSCLHYFLSFATGRWAGVALPIGVDVGGKRVFEEWGMRRTADGAWSGSSSWFDRHHGEFLPQVFPGFVSLWKNTIWRKPLTYALYWYLGACDRGVGIGVDTGLILAQTALETLAWTYCVLDRKMVSANAFKPRGLSAADKLRLLTSSLCIPHEVPLGLAALHGKQGGKWVDGLDAITGIRNSLVHSDVNAELPENSYFEAWKLSLWYVDLVLLRLCGHNGNYANRLTHTRWVGQVESVPWAKNRAQTER